MRILTNSLLALLLSFWVAGCDSSAQQSGNDAQRFFEQFMKPRTPVEMQEEAEMRGGLMEVGQLTAYFCRNIYPRPTIAECIDKVKHGIGRSADPHSEYFNAKEMREFAESSSGVFSGIGIELARPSGPNSPLLVVNTIPDSPAEKAGLKSGDFITHIIKDASTRIATASLANIDAAVKLLRGVPGTSVTVEIARQGVPERLKFALVRQSVKSVSVESDIITHEGKSYAYLRAKQFQEGTAKEFELQFNRVKQKAGGRLDGLIINMENNPGGRLEEAYNMIRLIDASAGDIILTRDNDGISSYVPHRTQLLRETPRSITGSIPILVVVNGGCASACEVVAKSLKHKGIAVIAGTEETFMKGIVQCVESGNDGTAIKRTCSEYLIGNLQDWVPVQCYGVGIDTKFEYPGAKPLERLSECMLDAHVKSAGLMPNAPVHASIKDANPTMYILSEKMLDAFKGYMVVKLEERKAKDKEIEERLKTK